MSFDLAQISAQNKLITRTQKAVRRLHSEKCMRDLVYFIKYVAGPDDYLMKNYHLTDRHMKPHIKNQLIRTKGMDAVHYYICDLLMWQMAGYGVKNSEIPYHTPVGDVIKEYDTPEFDSFVRIYCPTREQFYDPIVRVGPWRNGDPIPDVQGGKKPNGIFCVFNPKTRGMLLAMSRGSLKSVILGWAEAWYLANNPLKRYTYFSYSEERAEQFLKSVKQCIDTPRWREAFPNIRKPEKRNEGRWTTQCADIWVDGISNYIDDMEIDLSGEKAGKESQMTIHGFNTEPTGIHVDYVRMDDPECTETEKAGKIFQVHRKFQHFVGPLLNPGGFWNVAGTIHDKFNGLIMNLIRGQTVHDYGVVNMVVASEEFQDRTPMYLKYTPEFLREIRSKMSSDEYAKHYQLFACDDHNSEFDLENINWRPQDEHFKELRGQIIKKIVMACDTSDTTGAKSDYWAYAAYATVTIGGSDELWLVHAHHTKRGAMNSVKEYFRVYDYIRRRFPTVPIEDYIDITNELAYSNYIDLREKRKSEAKLIQYKHKGQSKDARIYAFRDLMERIVFNWPERYEWAYVAGGQNPKGSVTIDMIGPAKDQMTSFRGQDRNKKDDILDAHATCCEMSAPQADYIDVEKRRAEILSRKKKPKKSILDVVYRSLGTGSDSNSLSPCLADRVQGNSRVGSRRPRCVPSSRNGGVTMPRR